MNFVKSRCYEILSESDEQIQIQAKIGDAVYNCGGKLGNNYPDLELSNKF